MPIGILALATAAAVAVPSPTEPVPGLTVEDARTLPPETLADIALRQIADQVRIVTRPTYDSPFVPGERLSSLEFALPARSSSYAGLCEATVLRVSFFDPYSARTERGDIPVRARDVTTDVRYKVIGEVSPSYASPFEARQRQEPRCREERQILWPENRTLGHRHFFTSEGDLGAAHSVAVLQRLVREVRENRYSDHGCVGWQACADSGELLRTLSFDDLRHINVVRDPTDPSRYNVKASFLVAGTHDTIISNELDVEVVMGGYPLAIERLGPTHIRRSWLIRD